MLNVGDRVIYSSGEDSWNGSVGVVTEINCRQFTENVTAVAWETGPAKKYQDVNYPGRGFMRNYTSCLEVVKFTYDPTQAGDTDDDV